MLEAQGIWGHNAKMSPGTHYHGFLLVSSWISALLPPWMKPCVEQIHRTCSAIFYDKSHSISHVGWQALLLNKHCISSTIIYIWMGLLEALHFIHCAANSITCCGLSVWPLGHYQLPRQLNLSLAVSQNGLWICNTNCVNKANILHFFYGYFQAVAGKKRHNNASHLGYVTPLIEKHAPLRGALGRPVLSRSMPCAVVRFRVKWAPVDLPWIQLSSLHGWPALPLASLKLALLVWAFVVVGLQNSSIWAPCRRGAHRIAHFLQYGPFPLYLVLWPSCSRAVLEIRMVQPNERDPAQLMMISSWWALNKVSYSLYIPTSKTTNTPTPGAGMKRWRDASSLLWNWRIPPVCSLKESRFPERFFSFFILNRE